MSMDKLRDAIQQRIKEGQQPVLLECEVLSVDKKAETCTVNHLDSGIEYPEVQLRAFEIEKMGLGLTIFPKVGCICTVAIIDLYSTSAMMINCGEVESVVFKMEGFEFVLKDGLKMNGGENGGMALAKVIAKKLAVLEAKHDALATYLGSLPLPVAGAVSGAPVPSSVEAFKVGQMTTEDEISNPKIRH